MVSSARISVADTAVALNTAGTAGTSLLIKNSGANPADLGDSAVTLGAGFELAAGDEVEIRVDPTEELFAVAAASPNDTTLQVLRT